MSSAPDDWAALEEGQTNPTMSNTITQHSFAEEALQEGDEEPEDDAPINFFSDLVQRVVTSQDRGRRDTRRRRTTMQHSNQTAGVI
mmetsp:Transcript_44256/g.69211  ORF Transcript_44256/g.69211 Transcript_44256/m.69211 type:complete len:86 (+) Transcript_44256:140-397(+)